MGGWSGGARAGAGRPTKSAVAAREAGAAGAGTAAPLPLVDIAGLVRPTPGSSQLSTTGHQYHWMMAHLYNQAATDLTGMDPRDGAGRSLTDVYAPVGLCTLESS
jgi:hypothetical protein